MSSSGSLPLTHKVLIALENLLSRCLLSVLTNVLFVLAASLFTWGFYPQGPSPQWLFFLCHDGLSMLSLHGVWLPRGYVPRMSIPRGSISKKRKLPDSWSLWLEFVEHNFSHSLFVKEATGPTHVQRGREMISSCWRGVTLWKSTQDGWYCCGLPWKIQASQNNIHLQTVFTPISRLPKFIP